MASMVVGVKNESANTELDQLTMQECHEDIGLALLEIWLSPLHMQ